MPDAAPRGDSLYMPSVRGLEVWSHSLQCPNSGVADHLYLSVRSHTCKEDFHEKKQFKRIMSPVENNVCYTAGNENLTKK